jgi:phage-related tail protein
MTANQGEAFSLIEKKINDLVALVAALREEKGRLAAELEQKTGLLAELEHKSAEAARKGAEAEDLSRKLAEFASERAEVKNRVEKLLGRLEGIEL